MVLCMYLAISVHQPGKISLKQDHGGQNMTKCNVAVYLGSKKSNKVMK